MNKVKTKKKKVFLWCLCVFILVFAFVVDALSPKILSFVVDRGREKVIDMVADGTLAVAENGCVKLPKWLSFVSDSGECFVTYFDGETAMLFYTMRLLPESSKCILYITDEIEGIDYINTQKYRLTKDFFDVQKLDDNIYKAKL